MKKAFSSPRVGFAVSLILISLPQIVRADDDPVIGTWKMNLGKSAFLQGPGFKSEMRTYEKQPDGVKVTIRTVDSTGKLVISSYLSTPDGQRHSVTGEGGPADAVALKQINDFTAESTLMHAGREVAKTTRVVSPDRKHMTITYFGLDPVGTQVNYRMVFDKVE